VATRWQPEDRGGLAERHALHPRPGRADAQGAASGVTPKLLGFDL